MEVIGPFMIFIYFAIVALAGGKVFYDYHNRQLVKANFWLNVAIFSLLAFLSFIVITEFYSSN